MEILGQAKNGQITQAIKTYEELTDEEKGALRLTAGSSIEDYKNYLVTCTKTGDRLTVKGKDLSEAKKQELSEHVDVVDALEVVYGKKGTKRNEAAKKSVNRSLKNQGDNATIENDTTADIELINELLASDLSAYRIAEVTGISRTTITNYRNGKSSIGNMALSSAIALTNMSKKVNAGYYNEV